MRRLLRDQLKGDGWTESHHPAACIYDANKKCPFGSELHENHDQCPCAEIQDVQMTLDSTQ